MKAKLKGSYVQCYSKTCYIYRRPQNTAVRVVVQRQQTISAFLIFIIITIPVVFHIPCSIAYYVAYRHTDTICVCLISCQIVSTEHDTPVVVRCFARVGSEWVKILTVS